MVERFVAPRLEDLDELSVTFPSPGEPWVVSVVERARDGDEVRMTWDEVAASVRISWVADGRERLLLEWEEIFRVEIECLDGRVDFRARLRSTGLEGAIFVTIGETVTIKDTVLRH